MNINRIIITGNLVANPTLRNTESGTQVASATIANNEFYNDGEGERQQVTTFVEVTVWVKSGENFASLAKKAQEVIIEGLLRRNDWESTLLPYVSNPDTAWRRRHRRAARRCDTSSAKTARLKLRRSGLHCGRS